MAGLSMREELTVLTMIFFFCIVTIPIIVFSNSKSSETVTEAPTNVSLVARFFQTNFRDRTAMNIVRVAENQRNTSRYPKVGVSILQNVDSLEFFEKFHSILPRERYFPLPSKEEIDALWEKFSFRNKTLLASDNTVIPLKVDWRDRGVVSRVKQQSACGACWAYSSVGVIESMSAIKQGALHELSTSQMLECNDEEMDCSGGDPHRLLEWLYEQQIDIQTEESFVRSKDGKGKCTASDKPGIRIKDFSLNDFTGSEHLMLFHLAYQGPLITCVNSINWLAYQNGIIQQNCSDKSKYLNHAVEIVGYDMTDTVPYYIVKNSWGPNFGIGGYLKIAIGNNLCGIAERVSAVVVQ